MAKKWGKTISKMKKGFQEKAEILKSCIVNPVSVCKATPDVCIVRQTRRSEECLSCRSFVR